MMNIFPTSCSNKLTYTSQVDLNAQKIYAHPLSEEPYSSLHWCRVPSPILSAQMLTVHGLSWVLDAALGGLSEDALIIVSEVSVERGKKKSLVIITCALELYC